MCKGSNVNLKMCMKIENPEKTMEIFKKATKKESIFSKLLKFFK